MNYLKNRLTYILVGTLFAYSSVNGQGLTTSEPPVPQVEKVLTSASINYLGLAVLQERGISSQATVLYGLGAHYSFYTTGSPPLLGARFIDEVNKYFGRDYSTKRITPYIFAEIRLYTALFKRSVHGQDTRANSANYFGLVGEIPFATGDLINVPNLALAYPVGIKYGLRRPLGQKIYVEGSIGAFLKISSVQQQLVPRIDIAFAWHK